MRLRAPLWVFPRNWRERYADEITDLFGESSRPFSDWVDLVRMGSLIRLEEQMRTLLTIALTAAAALALVAIGYSIAQLSEGVSEVHQHWWSTAPIAGFVASSAALIWIQRTVKPANASAA